MAIFLHFRHRTVAMLISCASLLTAAEAGGAAPEGAPDVGVGDDVPLTLVQPGPSPDDDDDGPAGALSSAMVNSVNPVHS